MFSSQDPDTGLKALLKYGNSGPPSNLHPLITSVEILLSTVRLLKVLRCVTFHSFRAYLHVYAFYTVAFSVSQS